MTCFIDPLQKEVIMMSKDIKNKRLAKPKFMVKCASRKKVDLCSFVVGKGDQEAI